MKLKMLTIFFIVSCFFMSTLSFNLYCDELDQLLQEAVESEGAANVTVPAQDSQSGIQPSVDDPEAIPQVKKDKKNKKKKYSKSKKRKKGKKHHKRSKNKKKKKKSRSY